MIRNPDYRSVCNNSIVHTRTNCISFIYGNVVDNPALALNFGNVNKEILYLSQNCQFEFIVAESPTKIGSVRWQETYWQ